MSNYQTVISCVLFKYALLAHRTAAISGKHVEYVVVLADFDLDIE